MHFVRCLKTKASSFSSPWASVSSDDGSWARAALLSGPPGIGKTTTAGVVCRELIFTTIELNASDVRSKRTLHAILSDALGMHSLAGMATGTESSLSSRHHALIMDEVDGMTGNNDRGGMQELISLIKTTRIPIICMCNDRQSVKVGHLVVVNFNLFLPLCYYSYEHKSSGFQDQDVVVFGMVAVSLRLLEEG
ncbi:unnamed protein product [Protopolystoma xenopodis]|uniref:ATPase AAA-type core domain-containing protein n=1 Tax=Protopolystoma xenopodis TaxID=117903 RepID=A0A3S5CNN0_9PLAT|nr:unnamed protein product [Protopolystoma xenopodis]